jgi:hypothetical protein
MQGTRNIKKIFDKGTSWTVANRKTDKNMGARVEIFHNGVHIPFKVIIYHNFFKMHIALSQPNPYVRNILTYA